MAFTNGLSERMGELRFPNPRSPNDEAPYSGYVSPPRGQNPFFSPFQSSTNDTRGSLQRRFTTDSSKMSSLSGMGGQSSTMVKSQFTASYEKKRQQIEQVREQKRKFEAQMKLLDLQEQRLQQSTNTSDMEHLARGFGRANLAGGPVSEPTTPPDYADTGFPTSFSRPNRFSINSVTSPPGLNNRFSQSSSQLASSPSGIVNGRFPSQKPPAKSMPGSRRNSEGRNSEDEEYFPEELATYRSTAIGSRYSMPANGMKSQQRSSVPTHSGLGPLNTTSFLFDDNDDKQMSADSQSVITSPNATSFLQMTPNDDNFPTLRSDRTSGILSANSAALDLANSRSPDPESWASFTRPRPNHQSMPQTGLNMFRPVLNSPPNEQNFDLAMSQPPVSTQKPQRHSMGVTFNGVGETSRYEQPAMTSIGSSASRPTSLLSSFSTNDLPTVKNSTALASNINASKANIDQHFHNHNANLGRIPPGAASNRQSRDFPVVPTAAESKRDDKVQNVQSLLQANATPFGPPMISTTDSNALSTALLPYSANTAPGAYGFGMQTYNLSSNSPTNQVQAVQSGYNGYSVYGGYGRLQDSQTRVVHQRRPQGGGEAARYDNVPIENYRGKLYDLCKDQHGCRYLQKRLEEKNPEHTMMIFRETLPFVVELMTDPFGNYLCQKLLEYSDNDQRTALIGQAAPAMVSIALNQHGTRALQKMVEYVSTPEQIDIIVFALKDRVVELVQDLNGNHVVQKCLNKLGPENSQFIFDAVGRHCVIVGTHRHGCCVLQRCIDHAKGAQRAQLIAAITSNAFSLVQDPFGNYVVQYILDLDEPSFTKPLCHNFAGNIPSLSKQKFSSNVIEKCLRTADFETKRTMIEEMLHSNEIEKMLRDSFANYVVQTAMDYADPDTKMRMVDTIRPILPAIKQTPHGRRIASKIMGADGQGRLSGTSSGQMTPSESTAPSSFARAKSSNNEAVGRRQFQIYGQHGLFQGNNNSSRFMNQGFPDGMENNFSGSGYTGLNGMSDVFGDPARSGDTSFSSYNGLQPGPGYI